MKITVIYLAVKRPRRVTSAHVRGLAARSANAGFPVAYCLLESEFASEQGAVLNVVFAAPKGNRSPERRAAIEEAIARPKSRELAPHNGEAGPESVGDPFSRDTFSDDGRIAYSQPEMW